MVVTLAVLQWILTMLKAALFVGLVPLLVFAACTRSPLGNLPRDPSAVEVVSSQEPGSPSGAFLTPLWGDRADDREAIASLIEALARANPVAASKEEGTQETERFLRIRYRDGTEVQMRPAWWCASWVVEGTYCSANGKRVPEHWFVESPNMTGIVESPTLSAWWDHLDEYMPPVKRLTYPLVVRKGETFAVSGEALLRGDSVRLTIEVPGMPKMLLAAIPLDHGSFVWQGTLPPDIPAGSALLYVEVPGVSMDGDTLTVLE